MKPNQTRTRGKAHRARRSPLAPNDPRRGWFVAVTGCGLLVLAAVLITAVRPIMDPDTWFHLAFGRLTHQQGSIPRADVFSHTSPGNEWISSGWLASVLMYRIHLLGESGAGLIWMSFAIIALAYGSAYVGLVRGYRAPGAIATLLILGTGISIARFSPRPDLWSQLGISLLLLLLLSVDRTAHEQQRIARRIWLLPLLIALWANLHAGFMAGLLTLGIYALWQCYCIALRKERWRLGTLPPLLISAFAWMLNPYGPRLAELARKIQTIPDVGWVLEWMPLLRSGFLPPAFSLLLIVLFMALAAWVAVRGRDRLLGWHWGVLALFVLLALLQRRQVGLASLAIPLALAPAFAALDTWKASRRLLVITAAGALLLVGTLHQRGLLLSDRSFLRTGINCTALPCDARDYLLEHRLPGNLFNSYGLGGFLLFHLAPETPVFIDGRLDVYDHQVWRDYLAVDDGRLDPSAVQVRYGIKSWVVGSADAVGDPEHLASRLAASAQHALVYFDDQVAIFLDRSSLAPPHREFTQVTPWKHASLTAENLTGPALETAAEEADRAIAYSNGSASAWALAALVAHGAGDREAAAAALGQSSARDNQNPLLRLAQAAYPVKK